MDELEREMRGLGPRKGTGPPPAPGQTGLVTNNKILQLNKPPAAAPPAEKPAAAAPPMQRTLCFASVAMTLRQVA